MEIKLYSSGYEHQKDYVLPYVESVKKHEPKANLTIVDNGSPEPYPAEFLGFPVKRTDNLAIMTSFNRVIEDADWLMLTDTDVICQGEFLKYLAGFDPHYLYGQQVFRQGEVEWFDGWLFCVPRLIWETIGKFDEEFKLTGAFQDLDYCIRAKQAGFGLRKSNLPFIHLEANTTHGSPLFWENREYNKKLILAKHGVNIDSFR